MLPSNAAACSRRASAWNLLNAFCIRSPLSRSCAICCLAVHTGLLAFLCSHSHSLPRSTHYIPLRVPVNRPVSPPKKIPPAPNRVYVAKSPSLLGFTTAVKSGNTSSRPSAKRTAWGFSAARKVVNIRRRADRRRKARSEARVRPTREPMPVWRETVLAAERSASRSDWVKLEEEEFSSAAG
jgi:hypothetical protein